MIRRKEEERGNRYGIKIKEKKRVITFNSSPIF